MALVFHGALEAFARGEVRGAMAAPDGLEAASDLLGDADRLLIAVEISLGPDQHAGERVRARPVGREAGRREQPEADGERGDEGEAHGDINGTRPRGVKRSARAAD